MHRARASDHAEGGAGDRKSGPICWAKESVSHPVRVPLGREDDIAAGVHEVQNALTSVMGWLDIARSTKDAVLRERALEVIDRGIQRVRRLVAALADPTERFNVRSRAFRVGPLVAETHEFLHPRCAAVGVQLRVDCTDEDLVAQGDPERVLQILTNLVLNAVDAVLALPVREQGRGHVNIQVGASDRHVSIAVRDDGIGMDDSTLARIFDPYFTTHPTAVGERSAGSGLGLAISKVLAEAMQGRLEVQSAPGVGTTVTLVLLRDGALPSVVPPPEAQGLCAPIRVLVVDDEPSIRELLEVALSLRGAQVTVAASVDEARSVLTQRVFDVVLVDETLGPHDSGAALLLDLSRTMPAVARVLMTGAASIEHLPAEACRWLVRKPFSLDEVVRVIGDALADNGS